jgi:hypothetical protein
VYRALAVSRRGAIEAFAVVDPDVYEWAAGLRWRIHRSNRNRLGYVRRSLADGDFLHRLVLGLEKGDRRRVDHIDGDPLNNTRANLRIATNAENAQNRRSRAGAKSKHRGVCWIAARGKWLASGSVDGEQYKLGLFNDELEAARVAAAWRAEHMPFSQEALKAAP